MKTTLIVIESDADMAEAQALVSDLMHSDNPADIARLQAQARLIEVYERNQWPRRKVTPADILVYLLDQHGLTEADLTPLLGTSNRVNDVLAGRKGLSVAMVQRLRERFDISADVLISPDCH